MASELVDIFDANMTPIAPFRMEKDDVHKHGIWHQTFHCWMFRRDPSGDKILLQLRGADKQDNPNTFDISAAGHLQTGETPTDGLREVEEELGVEVSIESLLYLGIFKQASDRPGYYNREFCHTYFCETEALLTEYTPQEEEVDGVFELDITEGKKLFSGEVDSVVIHGIYKENGVYRPHTRELRAEHMCGYNDRCVVTKYYLKILVLAYLFLRDVRPLAI
jgi:isopentenyldiphosphate isomerase